MKRLIIFPASSVIIPCFFLILLQPFGVETIRAELVDRVVAIVNNDIITLSELEEEASGLYSLIARKSEKNGPLMDELDKAREITLNNLIDRMLIEQKAREENIGVSDEEVDQAFNTMLEESHLSREEFIAKLEDSGMTEKLYRSKLRTRILQSKLVSRDVRSKVVITDEMILDYYDTHYTARVEKGSYYILQMGFTWDSELEPEQLSKSRSTAQKRAERIRRLALADQDFKTLAKKFSDLPSGSDGGDIGVFTLDDMAPAMRDAVSQLHPGEISEIVEIGSSFQFFKVLSGGEDSIVVKASLESVRDEIKNKLYQEKLQEDFSQWIEKLRSNAYIQKL